MLHHLQRNFPHTAKALLNGGLLHVREDWSYGIPADAPTGNVAPVRFTEMFNLFFIFLGYNLATFTSDIIR